MSGGNPRGGPPLAEAGPVLAFDTTGSLGSAAVVWADTDGGVTEAATETFEPSNQHARQLLPAIRAVLDAARIRDGDLVLLAAARGPGSFTGLRVGLATLQGLALGSGVPAVGLSSLDAAALADALAGGRPVRRLAVVDALRSEVFAAIHEPRRPSRPALGPRRLAPEAAGAWAAECGVERICGPAVARYAEALAAGASARGGGSVDLAAERRPLAPAVARLGIEAGRRGEANLAPLYLRAPEIHAN